MKKVTALEAVRATVVEPSIAILGKALSVDVPGIGQVSIIAQDNDVAVAAFDKLLGDEHKGVDVNLAGIQDVAMFQRSRLTVKA